MRYSTVDIRQEVENESQPEEVDDLVDERPKDDLSDLKSYKRNVKPTHKPSSQPRHLLLVGALNSLNSHVYLRVGLQISLVDHG